MLAKAPDKNDGTVPKTAAAPADAKDAKGTVAAPAPIEKAYSREATKALSGGNGDAIVDIRVSINEQQEFELSTAGYMQIQQEPIFVAGARRPVAPQGASTFGNKASLWIWRRSLGVCSGRLKPIVDIILDGTAASSELVISGYSANPNLIAAQTVWIKRAATEDDEKDAIIDLFVTTGRSKDTSDPIWTSPGVGWIRIDGNFTKSMFGSLDSFLWYRPNRNRPPNMQLSNPLRGTVALTDEVRLTRLIAAARVILRHYIPISDMKRLASLKLQEGETSAAVASSVRSERIVDFSALFHRYEQRGKMTSSKWSKMMLDIGMKMKTSDMTLCFNFFDANKGGSISIDEYTRVLALTDYELDIAAEKIRLKLMNACVENAASASSRNGNTFDAMGRSQFGVIGAQSIVANPDIGKNLIRENMTLSNIFSLINGKADDILSIDEIMDLAARLEVFLSEEEAQRIVKMMDIDNDNRVTEQDFLTFMRRESQANIHKAFRVQDAASLFRRWLVRGANDREVNVTATNQQWQELKSQFEHSTGQRFPGYLNAQVLQLKIGLLGLRLSAVEARELTLVIAPEKSGKVNQVELQAFMARSCRSFGELIAVMSRELFRDLVVAYRANAQATRTTGKENSELASIYKQKIAEVKRAVEGIYFKQSIAKSTGGDAKAELKVDDAAAIQAAILARGDPRFPKISPDFIPIAQLRLGLHDALNVNKLPEKQLPNIEEWACLAVLVDADVTEGDIYGVRLQAFLEGMCKYVAENDIRSRGDRSDFDIIVRELKLQIYREGMTHSKDKKRPDYKAVFDIFDADHNGSITTVEFRGYLNRLQLLSSLNDQQIGALIALFDKKKKNVIDFEDFKAFADDVDKVVKDDLSSAAGGKSGGGSGALGSIGGGGLGGMMDHDAIGADDLVDDDPEDLLLHSGTPPAQLTKNADCDWLSWFLYRQAYHVDPTDAEGVITELQSYCAEAEAAQDKPGISVKEFWTLLHELEIAGNLSKAQFVKGVQLVCDKGTGEENDRVDFTALCKIAVRMGRAYLGQIQERERLVDKNFAPLLAELREFFKKIRLENIAEKDTTPRFIKLFHRLDSDHDGMLTVKEFRLGLHRLQYTDTAKWTGRMTRRLFDVCDRNKDGLLSLDEFTTFILELPAKGEDKRSTGPEDTIPPRGGGRDVDDYLLSKKESKGISGLMDYDSDGGDEIFNKRQAHLTDHQLQRKIVETLLENVRSESGNPAKHLDEVRVNVRRFFQRHDAEFSGLTSEELFRSFLRRSGLQQVLTTSEIRRVTDKLKVKGKGKNSSLINYERFITQLLILTETPPRSQSEMLVMRFQDAALGSAAKNRSFPALCSLLDSRFTGRISKEELVHIAKMMDCPLTSSEVEGMLDIVPGPIVQGRDRELIDYAALNTWLQTYQPGGRDALFRGSSSQNYGQSMIFPDPAMQPPPPYMRHSYNIGALPGYASPNHVTMATPGMGFSGTHAAVTTPLGQSISTPFGQRMNAAAADGYMGVNNVYADRSTRVILERIKSALDNQRLPANHFRRRLEGMDTQGSGMVPSRTVAHICDDVYQVTLTANDVLSLLQRYGHPSEDLIFYDALGRAIETLDISTSTSMVPTHNSQQFGNSSNSGNNHGTGNGTQGLDPSVYINHRVLQRLQELKADRRTPRDIFRAYDLDNMGLVPAAKFRTVIEQLQLLQTQHQLIKAMDDFAAVGNQQMINYEEFCAALDRAANRGDFYSHGYGGNDDRLNMSASMTRRGIAEHDNIADDPIRLSPRYFEDDDRNNNNNNNTMMRSSRGGYDLDRGSVFNQSVDYGQQGPLSPPKLTDSLHAPLNSSHNRFQPNRYSTPQRSSNSMSMTAPRTSPSKVGTRMWGSHTPWQRKGRVPIVPEDKWVCAVCLYVENPNEAGNCIVCDSPNYALRKDYVIKEQCRNCTFLNGQFAEECEMCGEPLTTPGKPSLR